MKRNGILNSSISSVLSGMGHTDTLAVADCGLPVPEGTKRIDLAVTFGRPGFMEVLREVALDMKIEKIILAEEIKDKNPEVLREIHMLFQELQEKPEVEFMPHSSFKEQTRRCKAVIRTGETTPYANIILQSGCIF